ncbi:hypothetical protein ACJJTC_009187 [Scirpophaga incertulas]
MITVNYFENTTICEDFSCHKIKQKVMEYHEMTAELDAREILRYLNNLGIQNVSGEVLKYFITDLKKLIKYDLQQKETVFEKQLVSERLHSASTFSSRIRSKGTHGLLLNCGKDILGSKRHVQRIHSAPILRDTNQENGHVSRRACSCVRVEKKNTVQETVAPANNNIIKVLPPPLKKKCDPVTLYHYYSSLWAKYKPNVPGENDWSDLRWTIRQKMAGSSLKPSKSRVEIVKKGGV